MLTKYSKPAGDVAAHSTMLLEQNAALLNKQRRLSRALVNAPPRLTCIVCESALGEGRILQHRGLDYRACPACGHVQSVALAPPGYPYQEQDFADIYKPLDPVAYEDRRRRIYDPKRDWALRAALEAGLGDLRAKSWLELGCGAGYFLDSLRAAGMGRVHGVEAEAPLVGQARERLGPGAVSHFMGALGQAVADHDADIYAAWFVLEHCFETAAFLDALRRKPIGTVFLFSVPVFGFATLIEALGERHFARNLDGVLHLQLFTDCSIRHAVERAGFAIAAEWLFGQDADDLYRAVAATEVAGDEELARLSGLRDALQGLIDRARLSDSRHILAVKR